MEKPLGKDSTEHNVFINELGMFEGEDEECRMGNDMRNSHSWLYAHHKTFIKFL